MSVSPVVYPLDVVEFEVWLASQLAGTIIGCSCLDGDCPLATFLQAQFGGSWAVSSSGYRALFPGSPRLSYWSSFLPAWALAFVFCLDAFFNYEVRFVSVENALAVLAASRIRLASGAYLEVLYG